jgi:predicted DNA-binding transcriptional regulator AlpA
VRSSRKRRPNDNRQMSMFDTVPAGPEDIPRRPEATPLRRTTSHQEQKLLPPSHKKAPVTPAVAREILSAGPTEHDAWWTTEDVCSYLRLGRKAVWERRRNPALDFPKPANLGGGRNHYRASAIKSWAERMALMSLLED